MSPCMCGDLYCGSCGPAQGNFRCGNCGRWAMDGGCEDPKACEAALAASMDAEAKYWQEAEQSAADYWSQHDR